MKSKNDSPTLPLNQTIIPVKALSLEVYDGNKLLSSAILENQSIIVGRILSADFKISDPRVSRFHALIERLDDGQLKITDLGSSQGTFVNGQKVVEKIVVPTDVVLLASLTLKIKWTTVIPEALKELHAQEHRTLTPAPETHVNVSASAGRSQIESSASPVKPRELTQVSSLREIARTRGVLDNAHTGFELEVTVYWENTILAVDHYQSGETSLSVGSDTRSTSTEHGRSVCRGISRSERRRENEEVSIRESRGQSQRFGYRCLGSREPQGGARRCFQRPQIWRKARFEVYEARF